MKKYIFIFFVLFSGFTSAYDGWSDFKQISIYRVRPNDYVLVRLGTTKHINPSNCTDTTWLAMKIDGSKSVDYIYSSIVSAHAAGKKIKFELEGCTEGGDKGNPNIVGVLVE